MESKIEIKKDGKMPCPNCAKSGNEIELRLHVISHRNDVYTARFNVITDTLVTVGDNPIDSDTLEVYDEYLYCPHCGCRYEIPWKTDDSDMPYDNVTYEADVLKIIEDGKPPHECPKCGNTEPSYIETVNLEREFVSFSGESMKFSSESEWHRGAGQARMQCPECQTEWSFPRDIKIDFH